MAALSPPSEALTMIAGGIITHEALKLSGQYKPISQWLKICLPYGIRSRIIKPTRRILIAGVGPATCEFLRLINASRVWQDVELLIVDGGNVTRQEILSGSGGTLTTKDIGQPRALAGTLRLNPEGKPILAWVGERKSEKLIPEKIFRGVHLIISDGATVPNAFGTQGYLAMCTR
mmetsp:Transcript_58/g.72  ORF Transcript_58/g.72 Transcript_58/m.72 type:complete len:175 (-) Transcript_58:840-1364(-)